MYPGHKEIYFPVTKKMLEENRSNFVFLGLPDYKHFVQMLAKCCLNSIGGRVGAGKGGYK